jgi:hypothetical protein
MPLIEIRRLAAVAILAVALLPAARARAAGDGNESPAAANPRSVDAAAMANLPCYFQGSAILQDDLAAGPSQAQDPAQAAAAQRINDAGIESCNVFATFGGACGGCGSYGSCGATGLSGRASGCASGLNTYGNSGW